MTVEAAIAARVAGLSAVTALVSTRVYLYELPENATFPNVCVQLIDLEEDQHLRGPDGLPVSRVQIDCGVQKASGLDYAAQLDELVAAVHGDGLGTSASGVCGFRGRIGSPAFEVRNCEPAGRHLLYDPDDRRVVTMKLDYLVRYRLN